MRPSLASPSLWDQVVSLQVLWGQVASLKVWPQSRPLQPPQPMESEKLVTFTFTFLFTLRQVVERQPETWLQLSQAKTACLGRWKIASLLGGLSCKIFLARCSSAACISGWFFLNSHCRSLFWQMVLSGRPSLYLHLVRPLHSDVSLCTLHCNQPNICDCCKMFTTCA